MTTKSLSRTKEYLPTFVDNFFKPWNEWFIPNDLWDNQLTLPAVNIAEQKDEFSLTLAAPGLKKDDFKISLEGDVLKISCEKEENKEEKDDKYTRKEYNYSSFNRSFTLPNTIMREKIDARYEEGILKIKLPKREDAVKTAISKAIEVK